MNLFWWIRLTFLVQEARIRGTSIHNLLTLRTLEFVERAVDNWRLLGSDPTDAKVLVQA
jgi:hypothetical protein